MALETGTYISDLVTSNPPQSDSLTQAAGHLRLIKSVIQATFPNITGAVTATHTNLNGAAGVYSNNQFVPTGAVSAYAGSSAPTGWLLCDGSAVSRTTYADLFAIISTTYGIGNGTTTFNVPDLRDRHIIGKANMGGVDAGLISSDFLNTATLGAEYDGDFGNNAYGSDYYNFALVTGNLPSHTHTFSGSVSGTTGSGGVDHYHNYSGTTSSGGSHSHTYSKPNTESPFANGGGQTVASDSMSSQSTSSDGSHTHTYSGSTGYSSGYLHTHSFSGSVSGTTGATGSGTSIWIGLLTPCIVLNYIIKT